MSKILITGGAGFIGYHLASALLEEGNEIHLLDNFLRGREDTELEKMLNNKKVTLIDGDIGNIETFNKLDKNYDYVYHLAAVIGVKLVEKQPLDVLKINSLGMINLVEWIKTCSPKPRVLFSSTSEIYGGTSKIFREDFKYPTSEDVPFCVDMLDSPRYTYSMSKAWGEMYIHFAAEKYDFSYTIVRYHNVYGPRMGAVHVIPELMIKAVTSEDGMLPVYSVDHTRAFCYVDDAVKGTILANTLETTKNTTINIGNDKEEINIGDLAKKILKVVEKENLEVTPLNPPSNSPSRRYPDVSLLAKLTSFRAEITLDQGLEKTYEWYKYNLKKEE